MQNKFNIKEKGFAWERGKCEARGKRGFTLIELLVVIAIIGLLATIIMAGLESSRERARNSRRIQMVEQYVNALELYRSDNSSYPEDEEGDWLCMGYSDAETCYADLYSGNSTFNGAIANYIGGTADSVPSNKDSIMAGASDFKGIIYECVDNTNCSNFSMIWLNEGSDENCGIGNSNGTIGAHTACVYSN